MATDWTQQTGHSAPSLRYKARRNDRNLSCGTHLGPQLKPALGGRIHDRSSLPPIQAKKTLQSRGRPYMTDLRLVYGAGPITALRVVASLRFTSGKMGYANFGSSLKTSSTGQAGAPGPVQCETVSASTFSSFLRSLILARISLKWTSAIVWTSPHDVAPPSASRRRVRTSSCENPISRDLLMNRSRFTSPAS